MLRLSQTRSATSFCRYAIARHQSTFTSKTGKVLGATLASRPTLALPGLPTSSVQWHLSSQVRTLQTTTQPPVKGSFTFPSDAKPAQVAELLASFRSEVESASRSNSRRRALATRERLGIRAFEWMKQLKELDQQLAISKEFCKDLSWLLLAEGEEGTLVEFLFSEAASDLHLHRNATIRLYHEEDVTGYRLRRNHHLLAFLIDAHVLLSTDGTANEALRCLSTLNDAAEEKSIFHSFQWAGVSTSLRRHLATNHCAPCDEKLLEALVDVVRKSTNPRDREREIAFLMLWHPTSPDPFRALKTIKNELKVGYAWKKGHKAVNYLGQSLLRTMFILDLQGATSEAQWARDTLQKKFSHVWQHHDIIVAKLKKDPKLKHLLKKPRASSIKDDESRNVMGDLLVMRQKAKPE